MDIPLRALIVTDQPAVAEMLLSELRREHYDPEWHRVDTEADFLARLDADPEIILADYSLPQFDAMRALRFLHERGLSIPLIVITGSIGEEAAAECIKQGAADYLLKDRPARLGQAVKMALEQKRLRAKKQQAEAALQETTAVLQALIQASPLAIIALDPQGNVRMWNRAAETTFGWSQEEALGGPLPIDPEDKQEEFRRLRQRVLEGEACAGVELRRQRRDGSPIDISLSTAPVRDGAGQVIGMVGVAMDITGRKRAEEQLRLQGAALEAAANAILITDRAGRITWANPAFSQLTGYSLEAVLGQDIRLLKSSQQDPAAYRDLWETVLDGRVWRGELLNRRKDGSEYLEGQTITPVRDERGEITHFIGIKRDITDRMRAEQELRGLNRALKVLGECNGVIVRSTDEAALLGDICRIVAGVGGYPFAWIALTGEDGGTTTRPGAHAGDDGSALRVIAIACEEADQGRGCMGTAIRAGKAVVVRDVLADPVFIRWRDEGGHAAYTCAAALPLTANGRTLGALNILSTNPDAFDPEEVKLLTELSNDLAFGVSSLRSRAARQRAEEALAARTRQLEAVRGVSEEVTQELDLPTLLRLITQRAVNLVQADAGGILLWDEKAEVLVPRSPLGDMEWLREASFKAGEGVVGTVAQRRQGMILNDYRTSPLAHPAVRDRGGVAAVLAEPLLYRTRLVGVIVLDRRDAGRPFTALEQETLALFAGQAAIAIENARLHESLVRRTHQFATLNALTRTLTTVLDPKRVADEVLVAVQSLIPGAAGRLWEEVGEDGELNVVASLGLKDPTGGLPLRHRFGEGLTGLAFTTRQPASSLDVGQDPRFINKAWAQAEGLVSCLVLPLVYPDRVMGALVIYTQTQHPFSEEEVGILRSLAANAAIALENARLFSATERAAREARSLYEIGQSLTTMLDPGDVLHLISVRTTELLGTPHAQVVLWDEDTETLRLGAAYGTEAEAVTRQVYRLGEGVNGIVAQTREPMIVNDYQAFPHRVQDLSHLAAVIAVPLLYRDRFLGVLSSHAIQPGARFSQEHLTLLTSFANQAAIALENARLYRKLRKHATLLEKRVEERTQDLAQANRQLAAASRHKSEFLANMSHEIRTPLNSIIGFAELLREQLAPTLSEKHGRFLSHVYTSGKHLLQLLNDILDISKVEAGKLALHPEPLPVAQTLEDILVIGRGLAHTKAQTIETEIQSGLPLLSADPIRFKQVLFNLLSNAVKFTPDGGLITVRAYQEAGGSGQKAGSSGQEAAEQALLPAAGCRLPALVIEVRDTGAGIRAEDMPRLFREFTQLETTAAQRHEGTGLGLALAKRLVELHGGRIWADSPGVGKGSTFTVMLPFAGPAT